MSKLLNTMAFIKPALHAIPKTQKMVFIKFYDKVLHLYETRLFKRGFFSFRTFCSSGETGYKVRSEDFSTEDMASASQQIVPPVSANNVFDILHAFQKTEILLQADKYGIFDKLEEHKGPMDVNKLAKDLDVKPDTLERFLNACTAMKLLKRTKSGKQVLFSNTPDASTYLTRKSEFNVIGLIGLVKVTIQPGYKLEGPIKIGTQQLHKALDFDTTKPDDFFKTLYGTKERFNVFVEGMDGYAKSCLHLFKDKDLKLDRFKHAVDLGGSFGTHARTLKKLYKGMKVTLADIKPVIEEAKKKTENKDAGLNFAECDFFKRSTMPEADLFVLGHVIHDWQDKQCEEIISNVYHSLSKGGAILILDKVLNPNKDGPAFLCQQDLLMLAVTQGKERSEEEFRGLLDKQGFKSITVKKDNNSPYYDAVLGVK